jgi:hypothetical protein
MATGLRYRGSPMGGPWGGRSPLRPMLMLREDVYEVIADYQGRDRFTGVP